MLTLLMRLSTIGKYGFEAGLNMLPIYSRAENK